MKTGQYILQFCKIDMRAIDGPGGSSYVARVNLQVRDHVDAITTSVIRKNSVAALGKAIEEAILTSHAREVVRDWQGKRTTRGASR